MISTPSPTWSRLAAILGVGGSPNDMTAGFDSSVLRPDPIRRRTILDWLAAGLDAVDPGPLTERAMASWRGREAVVIAIGKAAPAMARGADHVVDIVGGVCVTDHVERTSDRLTYLIGNHPLPGPASLAAAGAVLEVIVSTPKHLPLIGLISGGGSTLCDLPRPGVPVEYLAEVNRRLITAGASIAQLNLVRSHLSSVKCGGLSRAAGRPIDTYVLSDVGGADPAVVASGPTIPTEPNPSGALDVMIEAGIDVPERVWRAVSSVLEPIPTPPVTVVGDGFDFARAVAATTPESAIIVDSWLEGPVEQCLDRFLQDAGSGVNVAVGEPAVTVTGMGRGGRNTHSALLAATKIAGTSSVFIAFASDGVDGSSEAAGAIVDGGTLTRGGDPTEAIRTFESADYLSRSHDLLRCGPTGTNVSDIWVLWKP